MAKLSRKRAESVALLGIFLQIIAAVVTFIVFLWNHSACCLVLSYLLGAGWPFWFLAWLHQRRHRMAEQEEADWQRLMDERKVGGGKGQLFQVEEGEAFMMRNKLRSLERVWLSVGSLYIVLHLAGNFLLLFFVLRTGILASLDKDTAVLSAVFLAVQAFVLFLIGMYAGGMAKERVWRHVRAGASYMMFSAAASALGVFALIVSWLGFMQADRFLAYALIAGQAVVALEVLLNFIMNIYRPRLSNVEVRFAYDSRLLELITSPGGILRTAASTLDYQFGFKVSETWFYRFLERAIAPIILFEIVAFYLLTTLVIVAPDQTAMIERFGRISDGGRFVGPGLHLKWPWPIEAVYRFPAQRVLMVTAGYSGEETDRDKLWTVSHYANEQGFLVATAIDNSAPTPPGATSGAAPPPVNLIACNLAVQYRIKNYPLVPLIDPATGKPDPEAAAKNKEAERKNNEALYNFLYRVRQPDRLLASLASRELIQYLASVDFFKVMCTDREKAGVELKARIQKAADDAVEGQGLGVEILFACLEGVHPPVEGNVGKAFEDVVAAHESQQATIRTAEAQYIRDVTDAQSTADRTVAGAIAYRYERGVISQAEAEQFQKQLFAYKAAPGVYEVRTFLDEFEKDDWLSKIRKYVVAAAGWDTSVIRLNLEESQRSSLLDLPSYGKPPGTENKTSNAGQN